MSIAEFKSRNLVDPVPIETDAYLSYHNENFVTPK